MAEDKIEKDLIKEAEDGKGLSIFERYLTVWVAACIA